MVQLLKLSTFAAGFDPDWGTKISHVVWPKIINKK